MAFVSDLHEARAILLGRLGRHDQALETYVYRLQDYLKAEESVVGHCVDETSRAHADNLFFRLLTLDTANGFTNPGQQPRASSSPCLGYTSGRQCRRQAICCTLRWTLSAVTARGWTPSRLCSCCLPLLLQTTFALS